MIIDNKQNGENDTRTAAFKKQLEEANAHNREAITKFLAAEVKEITGWRQIQVKINPTYRQRELVKSGKINDVGQWSRITNALIALMPDTFKGNSPHAAYIRDGFLRDELLAAAKKNNIQIPAEEIKTKHLTLTNIDIESIIEESYDNMADLIPNSKWDNLARAFKEQTDQELLKQATKLAIESAELFQEITDIDSYLKWLEHDEQAKIILNEIRKKIHEKQSYYDKIAPSLFTIPNNKLANSLSFLTSPDNIGQEIDLRVSTVNKRGKKLAKPITTIVVCEYDNLPSDIQAVITEEDKQISNAIISLWVAGKNEDPHKHIIFTPRDIYEVLAGGKKDKKPSKAEYERICKTIEKLSSLRIKLEADRELESYGIKSDDPDKTRLKVKSNYLHTMGVSVTSKHKQDKRLDAWELIAEPIIYTYAKATKQIITVPIKVLAIEETDKAGKLAGKLVLMTKTRGAIRGYLMKRIEIMRANTNNNQSNTIKFKTLFNEIGETHQTRLEQKRDRDFIIQCLDYWKAIGFINDYKLNKERLAITGATIEAGTRPPAGLINKN